MAALRSMWTSSCRTPRQAGRVFSPKDADIVRHRCASGAHVVFVGTSGLKSMVMRGTLSVSVLNQTFARHGAHASYIMIMSPTNTSSESRMVESHFDRIGGPSACVIIKYSVAWVGAACRRRGAVVLVDSIDNHRAFSRATLSNEHYAAMDAIIVQTQAHADMVASWGHHAVVLPHPHGNLGSWSMASQVRPQLRGVGFVVSDSKNMPSRDEFRTILRGCCLANTTLYVINSKSDGIHIRPYGKNCSDVAWYQWFDPNATRLHVRSRAAPAFPSTFQHPICPVSAAGTVGSRTTAPRSTRHMAGVLADPTQQRKYYESPELLERIDVGLVWRPGHQQGGPIAISNRPPTRMHWWWSHRIPVIGYPMEAYLDAARRAQYPTELLNLTTADHIQHALVRIASVEDRVCLQRTAGHGARLSSPWHSSLELLVSVCSLAEQCGKPLPIQPNHDPTLSLRRARGLQRRNITIGPPEVAKQ